MTSHRIASALVAAFMLSAIAWAGPYEDGHAAAKRADYATAMRVWRPLAEKGHAGAQYEVGMMYYDGQGVARDLREAVKWYRLAAVQGDAMAQSNLGDLYANGRGVARDDVRAHMWSTVAAARGHTNAARNRDAFAKDMTPQQIAQANAMAQRCAAWKYTQCE